MTGILRFHQLPEKSKTNCGRSSMIETRKREMSQQAGLEEEPPRKIRQIVPERVGKIIDVTGDDDPMTR